MKKEYNDLMKNTPEGIDSGLENANHQCAGRRVIKSTKLNSKKIKKRLSISGTSSGLMFALQGSQQMRWGRKQERRAENFPNLGKEKDLQVQEAMRAPNQVNPRGSTPDTN